jgi:hypothetical protein
VWRPGIPRGRRRDSLVYDIDQRLKRTRAAVAKAACPPLEHTLPELHAAFAARRTPRSHRTVIAVVIASISAFGAVAAAGPYVDRTRLAHALFGSLSAVSGARVVPGTLSHVAQPATDPRTRVLFKRLSAVSTVRDTWTVRDGLVVRGSVPNRAPFYLIARRRNAPGPSGILLPDDAGAQPMAMRSFQSRTGSFQLLHGVSMSKEEEDRLVAAALGFSP